MLTHSETITKLMGAMLKVQGDVDGVKKNATNPAFKRNYASLESVVDAIRPACQECGLVVMQAPGAFREGVIAVETFIVHAESGEWIKSALELPLAKVDPQGAGSAITYAERYSLMALFNLPPVDDDGNDASRRPEPPRAVSNAPAVRLIELINMATTITALESTKRTEEFKAGYVGLSDDHKTRVEAAFKARAATLGAAA